MQGRSFATRDAYRRITCVAPVRQANPAVWSAPVATTLIDFAPPIVREHHAALEYRVRPAQITDIEALVALSGDRLGDGASGSLGASDLLRQLVFLPHATVLVGGYVGTIDLLVVDPTSEPDAVSDSLIEECLRSAGNKGCASVEAPQPDDPAEHARWERQGFIDGQPVLRRVVDPAGRRR